PAFTGLGAPYWTPNAKGSICGLTRDSTAAHVVRAALEAVAYQTRDLLEAMRADGAMSLREIRVDGGMVNNDWLMQFLADSLQIPIERSSLHETTALGAAFLAGLTTGVFDSLEQIKQLWQCQQRFQPQMDPAASDSLYQGWKKAIDGVILNH